MLRSRNVTRLLLLEYQLCIVSRWKKGALICQEVPAGFVTNLRCGPREQI